MKLAKMLLIDTLVGSAMLALTIPSYAAFHGRNLNRETFANDIRSDRNDIQRDRQDLRDDRNDLHQDRTELRQDLRNGASTGEIANDRHDIGRDQSELARNRQELHAERQDLRQDLAREHHSFSDWWHSWWDRR
jgi:chromosome segregation ATPase